MSTRPFDTRLRLLLITPEACPEAELTARTSAALAGGIGSVQLREKRAGGREVFRKAETLRRLTEDAGALLLINGRADVARAVGADGVHAGRREMPLTALRALLGPAAWLGFSAHASDGAAEVRDADFATFSPVFDSPSKGAPHGPAGLAKAVSRFRRPVIALGGLGHGRVAGMAAVGAEGVAVIRAVYDAPDVERAAATLLAEVRKEWKCLES